MTRSGDPDRLVGPPIAMAGFGDRHRVVSVIAMDWFRRSRWSEFRTLGALSDAFHELLAGLRGGDQALASESRWGLTGVARFDELVVGTQQYERWKQALTRRGYTVIEGDLLPGTMAETRPGQVMAVDPKQFTYLSMLHESRHVRQLERAVEQGIRNPFRADIRRIFEVGAYDYELRLAKRFAFSPASVQEIQEIAWKYWRKVAVKISTSLGQSLWR